MNTKPSPGDPIWDLSWTPPAPFWLESIDGDGDAWVSNHPPGIEMGDQAVVASAELADLRPRPVLTDPGDDYCRQCLEITATTGLVRCPTCGHVTHPSCAQAHQETGCGIRTV